MAIDQLHSLMIFTIAFCLFRDKRKDARKMALYLVSLNLLFFAFVSELNIEFIICLEIISFLLGGWYVTSLVRSINFSKYTVR